MFNILITPVTSYGNNINNSNLMKKANHYNEIFRTNSDFVIVEHYIKKMLGTAKQLVPVRTGNLQRSIKMQETSSGFAFFVDNQQAPYGVYVEKRPGKAYFVPAIEQHRDPLRKALVAFYRGKAVSGRS
jgi:hypothetical protein